MFDDDFAIAGSFDGSVIEYLEKNGINKILLYQVVWWENGRYVELCYIFNLLGTMCI